MIKVITYRALCASEIDRELFRVFVRHQVVDQCLRREENAWVVRSAPFVDDWSEEDYQFLIACLQNTIKTGGAVYGAFQEGKLKGFASVESGLFGEEHRYLDLTHSAIETQRFYRSLGCVDAARPQQKHAEAEPFDCQLEYPLCPAE